jgi:Ca-activated chloride channel family protein
MTKKHLRQITLTGCLIALTCLAMVFSGYSTQPEIKPAPAPGNNNGIVNLSGKLSQDKIHVSGDGIVSLALTMTADDIRDIKSAGETKHFQHADIVIVLDRSGSMAGKKLNDAKNAALNLLSELSPNDRIGLVIYSDEAQKLSDLTNVTPSAREWLTGNINCISAGGVTNLGQGLQEGINIITASKRTGRMGRIILISDGLANKGITDTVALGNIASVAVERNFSISSVGVGYDFNEQLMTAIADRGAGNYYFLENPSEFASVFQNEFHRARTLAASSVKLSVKENNGIKLVDAGGYPINIENNCAVIYPGDLKTGESRTLYLNFRFPTDRETTFKISDIVLNYQFLENHYTAALLKPLTLACVQDRKEAIASIDKGVWVNKVIKDDFNRLREEVARDIKLGQKKEAVQKIDQYYNKQQEINAHVQSGKVADNLAKDLPSLRSILDETFSGKPAEVADKQKKNAKTLQYEGYNERRMKN